MTKKISETGRGRHTRFTAAGVPYLKRSESGRVVFSTGNIASLLTISARTVQNLCDSGKIRSWQIPGGNDRRVYGEDVEQFMRDNNIPVPDELVALLRGGRDIVLFGCLQETAIKTHDRYAGRDDVVVLSTDCVWELAKVCTNVPRRGGTVVFGPANSVSEVNKLVGRVDPCFWRTVHLPGDDQEPSSKCNRGFRLPGETDQFLDNLDFGLTHLAFQ